MGWWWAMETSSMGGCCCSQLGRRTNCLFVWCNTTTYVCVCHLNAHQATTLQPGTVYTAPSACSSCASKPPTSTAVSSVLFWAVECR